MMYEMEIGNFVTGDFSFLSKPIFVNIVRSLYGTYQICIQTSKDGLERCKALKAQIEKRMDL